MDVDEYSQSFWESEKRAFGYSQRDYLHKAEEKIITLFKEEFNEMKMLDMGVGAGRTTPYFAELVEEYFGADYSKAMINACQKRFSKASYSTNFCVLDVRSMDIFEDDFFEFILFSVNGLDYIAHEDRLIALKELIRVNKPGGFLYFSSNNLLYVNNVFKFKFRSIPENC